MKQQFLIKSNSNYLQLDYYEYRHHKIHNFLLINIIIFVSLISSFFSDEMNMKITITINLNSGGETHIINAHGTNRKCPSKIYVNYNNWKEYSCKINLSQGSHSIIVEWYPSEFFTDCSNMFEDKTFITEINLSEFKANEVQYMAYMFKGCTALQKVTLPRITEYKLERTEKMFEGCISLISIVFSNNDFRTEKVTNMAQMFQDCKSLSSIIFPGSFITNVVEEIQDMFSGCYKYGLSF